MAPVPQRRPLVDRGHLLLRAGALLLGYALPVVARAQTPNDSAGLLAQQAMVAYREGTREALERSIQLWIHAMALLNRAGNRRGEGAMLNNIGVVHEALGRPDSALAYYRQALAIERAEGALALEGISLHNIGAVHEGLGRPDSALTYFHEALAIRRELGDRAGEGMTLHNVGNVHRALGRPDSALAYYRQALAIERAVGDRGHDGETRNNIGAVYGELGRPDSALAYYRQALAIRREVGDRTGEGLTLHNLGTVYSDLGRADSALAYYRQALAIRRDVGDRAGEGITLDNIGKVHVGLGRPDSALVYYRQALAIEQAVGDRASEGITLNSIGAVYGDLGRPDSALAYYHEALAIRREVGDRSGEGETLNNIGVVFQRDVLPRDLPRAAAYYDSAAAAQATVGAHAGGEANRVSFAEQRLSLFEGWTLAWLARAPELGGGVSALAALAAVERGRAQALLELMRRTSREAGPGGDLVAEGTRLLSAGTGGGAGVLSYLVTADTVVVWVAAPGRELEVTRRAVSRDTLTELVRALRGALGMGEVVRRRVALRGGGSLEAEAAAGERGAATRRQTSPGSFEALSRTLAGLLLPSQLGQRLGSVRELVIVPHGVLGLVPFAALPLDSSGIPLGSRYALRYAPSLAVLAEAEGRPGLPTGAPRAQALRQGLVVGNPTMPSASSLGEAFALSPLPGAAGEADGVAARLGVNTLTGDHATEAEVRRRLPRASVVHLATHGYAYATEARARQSFVALAPGEGDDGFLTVAEVLDDPALTLSADLVVLSACQTGLGDLKQAEGTVGLQRAFLAKGARTVLVSLWNVSDEATALLMRGFYAHWLDDGDHPTKAEALRRAQETVRADPRFAAPRYWAAFQLVGAR